MSDLTGRGHRVGSVKGRNMPRPEPSPDLDRLRVKELSARIASRAKVRWDPNPHRDPDIDSNYLARDLLDALASRTPDLGLRDAIVGEDPIVGESAFGYRRRILDIIGAWERRAASRTPDLEAAVRSAIGILEHTSDRHATDARLTLLAVLPTCGEVVRPFRANCMLPKGHKGAHSPTREAR